MGGAGEQPTFLTCHESVQTNTIVPMSSDGVQVGETLRNASNDYVFARPPGFHGEDDSQQLPVSITDLESVRAIQQVAEALQQAANAQKQVEMTESLLASL